MQGTCVLFWDQHPFFRDFSDPVSTITQVFDMIDLGHGEHLPLFGLESKELKAEQEPVDECKAQALALCSDHAVTPAQWALAEVLLKTGLLDDCFDEQEVNAIREKPQKG